MTNSLTKIGKMPGRMNDYALEPGSTLQDALDLAELNAESFEVKVDGNSITDFSTVVDNANVIMLTKKVKGNNGITKIGKMPGRMEEYALEPGSTVQDALNLAELDVENFEVKMDGNSIDDLNTSADGAAVIMLTKKVKGN